jgi:hypothetical protein
MGWASLLYLARAILIYSRAILDKVSKNTSRGGGREDPTTVAPPKSMNNFAPRGRLMLLLYLMK